MERVFSKSTLTNTKVRIVLFIKNNKFIRKISKPFISALRNKELRDFSHSRYSKKLESLKNKYEGQDCYIIGNGPSLTLEDLELLSSHNKITFAANGIYSLLDKTIWRPTFYVCVDKEAFKLYGDRIANINADYKLLDFTGRKSIGDNISENTFFFYLYGKFTDNRWDSPEPHISENVARYISDGRTVTFASIQFAIYMGFKKIYLLGMDHNYTNAIRKSGKIKQNDTATYANGIIDRGMGVQYVDVTNEAYLKALIYCTNHDIQIFNATRGGKLEIFKRVVLEHVL